MIEDLMGSQLTDLGSLSESQANATTDSISHARSMIQTVDDPNHLHIKILAAFLKCLPSYEGRLNIANDILQTDGSFQELLALGLHLKTAILIPGTLI